MKNLFWVISLFLCTSFVAQGQSVPFRVMWYNVENLFDTEDDPDKDDNEFLPSGKRYWTPKRYYHKLRQVARTITAAGEWDTPALVGLCEVENDSVLTHLLTRTPLRKQSYRYAISKGSDKRGINVALLYQRDKFAWVGEESIPVLYERSKEKPTRDILHVWGRVISGDTLDVFVCHLPSRSGGEKETEGYRRDACLLLRSLCDSLSLTRRNPNILLMGDFNDTPADRNIRDVLHARSMEESTPDDLLVNLFAGSFKSPFPGSHKYKGEWSQLDQIIINRELLTTSRSVHIIPGSPHIFAPSFLLKKDKTWNGKRPKRTYYGFQYEGGYSDHLPLIVDLSIGGGMP